ncbi:DUF5999 family protein [Streptomyces parvulus]|uniref:Uncharacterized protein n=1 Tax=Streptomyces parvulus TaxID=146923 RepID=A0A369V4M8_9ACTN|nr:DUF5999 family protein [Streptomyces parvulus]RDD87982.1 hypothetical protein DVZ84_15930 [Streptomyces parvulus]
MCVHRSSCPAAGSPAVGSPAPAPRDVAAHVVAAHPEQGWNLLCDGTIVFDDTGELRPDGGVVAPRRVAAGRLAMAA